MKKYIEQLKSNKKVLYISIAILILFVGTTFAYVVAQLSGGDFKLFNLNADTTDQLEFNVDKDISLSANQFNFAEGAGDLTDQAVATARLKANSTKNEAKYTYNVYFLIDKNEFKYTTEDKKTEILLQVTDPNGNNLTELSDLMYDETLQGFDITEESKLIRIANDYIITSNSSTNYTEQAWNIKVMFINLDTNQKENADKILNGKVMIQKNKPIDISINTNNIPKNFGALANMNCVGNEALYNYKYSEINIYNVNKSLSSCTLDFSEMPNKQKLNDYLIDLSNNNSAQGEESIIHETFNWPNEFIALEESEYKRITQYSSSYASDMSGTTITNAFLYNGTEWISQPSNMTSGQAYHLSFRVPNGYYQLCYELTSGNSNNSLNIYLGTGGSSSNKYPIYPSIFASSVSETSGCIDLGKFTSSLLYVNISQIAADAISTFRFSLKKADTNNTKTIDTGYRYEGQDPNNWVWFNNELWRIIGVFDSSSHGIFNTNLVKIIRANPIGELVWDKSGKNNWSTASLKSLLNNDYLNSINGTNGENCYASGTTSKSKCDYTLTGIKDEYRSMIKEVTWYLGGYNGNSNIMSDEMYMFERDANRKLKDNSSTIKAKVGLIYASDYGYAVPSTKCARTQNIIIYNATNYTTYNNDCSSNNWLYNGYVWTLTPSSSGVRIEESNIDIGMQGNSPSNSGLVFPTVYLDSAVYIIEGDGSILNPYIIGMK